MSNKTIGPKHFILDVRAALGNTLVLKSFGAPNHVYLPWCVLREIEEIGETKRNDTDGKIARQIGRYVSKHNMAALKRGVVQEDGSVLHVVDASKDEGAEDIRMNCTPYEKEILQCCLRVRKNVGGECVILITRKGTLRLMAQKLGIQAEDFRDKNAPELGQQYTGRITCDVSNREMNEFRQNRRIPVETVQKKNPSAPLYPNTFVTMKSPEKGHELGRVKDGMIIPLRNGNNRPCGFAAQNEGQKMMLEALMSEAPLVILNGEAGTGKTFMALVVAIEQMKKAPQRYGEIWISREAVGAGADIGALPGNELEKMGPFVRGIQHNLEKIHRNLMRRKQSSGSHEKRQKRENETQEDTGKLPQEELFAMYRVVLQSFEYIRGTTLEGYVLLDEAQNTTREQMKTFLTRAGKDAKVIIMGDISQIDKPGLTETDNGLTYAIETMKVEPLSWVVTMTPEECVRSKLAKAAATRMV